MRSDFEGCKEGKYGIFNNSGVVCAMEYHATQDWSFMCRRQNRWCNQERKDLAYSGRFKKTI